MMKKRAMLAAAAAIGVGSMAYAGSYTSPGGPIPDNQPANPLVITFNVNEGGLAVQSLSLTLTGLTHTWAGDLIMTLQAPNTPATTFYFRPGATTTSAVGDSSDLNGDYRMIDTGADMVSALAVQTSSTFVLPSGDYRPFNFTNGTGTGATSVFMSLNAAFGGQIQDGVWTLRITDNAALDTGALGSATLDITPVPEPTSLGLIGLAGLGLLARRRKA